MSPALGWAVLAGLGLGLGLIAVAAGVRSLGPVPLADRVAGAVAAVSPAARAHLATRRDRSMALLGLGPLLGIGVHGLGGLRTTGLGLLSDRATIRRRLRRRGSSGTVDGYRARRAGLAAAGAALGAGAAVGLAAAGTPIVLAVIALPAAAVLAAMAVDVVDERMASARAARLVDELPVVLEFLAIALAAGEGLVDALRRVAGIGRGELAGELGVVVARVAAGGSTVAELRELAAALEVPAITRAVEQLVGALERGAPIAEVLRAQAQDAREDDRARLLTSVGRKEVAMLVPLVLVILPATVILAIWPGLVVLRLGF